MTNKTIKIIGIAIIALLTLFLFSTKSEAASFSASISKTTVTVGDTFTVTVKANNAAGMYKVSTSNSNVSVSSGSTEEFLENGSATIKFKATKAGTVTITAKATDMTDLDDDTKAVTGSKTFTVTVKEKTTSNGGNNSSSGGTQTTEPTFKSVNETVYANSTVNVRKSWSTSSTILGTLQEGDSVKRTGKGSNGWDKVTYNGTTAYIKSSYLTTKKPETEVEEPDPEEEKKSNDATLKSLTVKEGKISPDFNKDKTEYTLNVANEITKVTVSATVNNSRATYKISGNDNLKVGENKVEVKVTAEDKTTKTYVIKVVRARAELEVQSIIVNTINGDGTLTPLSLSPEFSSQVYEYTLEDIDHTINSLKVEAIASLTDASIEITGAEDLKTGENTITVIAKIKKETTDEKAEEEYETKTYTIKVNKKEEPVVVPLTFSQKMQNWFQGLGNTVGTWYKTNQLKIFTISLMGSTVALFGLSIYIVVDNKKYKTLVKKLKDLTELNGQTAVESKEVQVENNIEAETNNEGGAGKKGGRHF